MSPATADFLFRPETADVIRERRLRLSYDGSLAFAHVERSFPPEQAAQLADHIAGIVERIPPPLWEEAEERYGPAY